MKPFHILVLLAATGIFSVATISAQPVQITSISANGQLTLTAPVGSDFSVEWSPALGSGAAWSDRWDFLTAVHSTNASMTLRVPMYYRVSCYTNRLFWPLKGGTSFVFAVTNALGEGTTQTVKVLGRCYIPEFTNYYGLFCEQAANVTGGVSEGSWMMRSDDQQICAINDPIMHLESLEFFRGTVGSVITNANDVRIAIVAIENVTVPAGTFTNCIKFHKTDLWSGNPNPTHDEWIAPGKGMVKWVDYDVDASAAIPVVYQLQSATGL